MFGPENGGLIFGSPVDRSVVRIDHDQALQALREELLPESKWSIAKPTIYAKD